MFCFFFFFFCFSFPIHHCANSAQLIPGRKNDINTESLSHLFHAVGEGMKIRNARVRQTFIYARSVITVPF
uniref:Putative secreted protein n=1 Tax=Rhipicephalus microplus TaxID=6941 RepID=A0A6M2DBR9_RHIMP